MRAADLTPVTEHIQRHMHPACLEGSELVSACQLTRTRRSGPGGQRKNKVETAVVLIHRPTGIRVEAAERRSQTENLRAAVWRLRLELAIQRRERPSTRPSSLWQSRCRQKRITVSPDHADFPAMLAEALDTLASLSFDMQSAASALCCTPTQLLRMLGSQPRALSWVNLERSNRGLHRLRAT